MGVPQEVAPGIHVATSRTMLTTSTVLSHDGEALLVDPAWMPHELDALARFVAGLRVVGGFATHAHHDHLLWHPGFGDGPRWASARTAELARTERPGLVAGLGRDFPDDLVGLMGRVEGLADGIPESAGFEIELVVHDGHAPGHTALWVPRERVLIASDMLSDVELPLPFDPDDVPAYVAGLDALAPYAARAAVVVPGHGHVGADALTRLDADRRYLDDVLRRGSSDDPRRGERWDGCRVPTTASACPRFRVASGSSKEADMAEATPSEIVQEYHRAWTGGDVDHALTLVADDVRCRAPGQDLVGKEAYSAFLAGFAPRLTGIADIATFADGDRVALFYYPHTAVTSTTPAAECFTVRDGKIVDSVLIFDRMSYAPPPA